MGIDPPVILPQNGGRVVSAAGANRWVICCRSRLRSAISAAVAMTVSAQSGLVRDLLPDDKLAESPPTPAVERGSYGHEITGGFRHLAQT